MARTNNLTNFLTDVAGAIKEKKGSETAIPAANFDTEILALPSQGTYEQKTINISANGSQTILPSAGYDAIDEITLNVAVPINRLQTKSYQFTQNTTLQLLPDTGYEGFDQVNIEINVPTIDTSDADATVDDIYQGKTAYVNGTKITGRTPNYPISNSNRFKYYYDYKQERDLPVQQQASNIGMANIDGTVVVTLQTPAISNFNRFAFSGDNKLKSAVGALALRGRFSILPENIKTGVTMIDAVGTFSTCNDAGISNVVYKSYWFDGPFEKLASGYYQFDGNDLAQSMLRITFNKTTAGAVKLSYKGTGLHVEDQEDPGSYLSGIGVDLDDGTDYVELEDSIDYTEIVFDNVAVGEHTILIDAWTDTETVLEIKLVDDKPITAAILDKGLTGFVNGDKVKGTYEPDLVYDLGTITYTQDGINSFLNRIRMAGMNVYKINHPVDCTGDTSLRIGSGLSEIGTLEEFPTLVNTSGISYISSNVWQPFSHLKVIPLFDISGITTGLDSIQNLYTVPSTVEEIPAFDLSNISDTSQFVQSTPPFMGLRNNINLSYESINNLLYTVSTINTQSIIPPYRTMSRLGFDTLTTNYDESIIQTLSNYPAFVSAGWSLS